MKRFAAILLMLMGLPALAQTTTTYVGTIKDLTGATVTSGRVTWTLSTSGATISGTGAFVATTVSCTINGSGTPVSSANPSNPCVITNNTALTPSGTSYTLCIQPQFASPGSCMVTYAYGGTVDISTLVPTSATQPYYGVAALYQANTWTQPQTFSQTINGTTTGNLTPSGYNFTTNTFPLSFLGNYSGSAYNSEMSVISDGASSSTAWALQGAVGGMSPLTVGVQVPAGSSLHQVNGIFPFVINNNLGVTNAVGSYPTAICEVNGSLCWGSNPVTSDNPSGSAAARLFGEEDDVNVNNAGTSGYGLGIVGAWTAQPSNMIALDIVEPVNGTWHWTTGLQFETGSVGTNPAIYIEATGPGTGHNSQDLCFESVGASSFNNCIYEDTNAAYTFKYNNGDLATMPQPNSTGAFPIGGPLETHGSVTLTGACSATGLQGSATAGTFNSGTTGTCTVNIVESTTAVNGWACPRPQDISTPANTNSWQVTGWTTTQITIAGTTTSGDEILFGPCVAF